MKEDEVDEDEEKKLKECPRILIHQISNLADDNFHMILSLEILTERCLHLNVRMNSTSQSFVSTFPTATRA